MPSSAESDLDRNRDETYPYSQPQAGAAASSEATPAAASQLRHPTLAADEEVFPLADAGEYYVGLWNGYPKYGCPVCAWTTLPNSAAEGDFRTESHIQEKASSSPKHAALLEKKGDNA